MTALPWFARDTLLAVETDHTHTAGSKVFTHLPVKDWAAEIKSRR